MNVFTRAPLFKVGFRPFFLLALIFGTIYPLLWILILTHNMPQNLMLPASSWHAHEMYFGFGWAVLGGFLLTASKNWVKIRGAHGGVLIFFVALWVLERVTLLGYFYWLPSWLNRIMIFGFLVSIVVYIVKTLIQYRKNDTFSDNFYFIIILPLFVVSKYLVLSSEFYALGLDMTSGLFRVCFAIMFERTITQFMKSTYQVNLVRVSYIDHSIKSMMVLCSIGFILPPVTYGILCVITGLLWLYRGYLWKPLIGMKKISTATMYIGYLALGIHLLFLGLEKIQLIQMLGALTTHIFTFLVMGLVIPSMLIRIIQGHTGRPIVFTKSDNIGLIFILVSGVFRLILTQVYVDKYMLWIQLSGVFWSLGYLLVASRLIWFLFYDRVDGKEH